MSVLVTLLLCLGLISAAPAQNLETLQAKPLVDQIRVKAKPVKSGNSFKVPMITWGGDVATIHADQQKLFKKNNLNAEIFVENNFAKQVEACLKGETPYLRGTMGMINAAAEVFQKNGVDLVVVYQMTWSNGGDAMVVRKNVRKPQRLKGKTVALQLYGPHMDYAFNILKTAGVPLSSVTFKWFSELTLPTFDTDGKIIDPVNAFLEDDSIDAAMAIIPDAMNLTSGGRGGTGSAGSVKGAKIMVSTKTASRVIADVYAVRADYFKNNRAEVERFVNTLLQAQESLQTLLQNKASQQARYQQLMSRSADLLMGAPQAVPDVEGLLADCEFVGFQGNVAFFTGKGTSRTLAKLTSEIQSAFKEVGLMKQSVKIEGAGWQYDKLSKGLKFVNAAPQPKKKFDTKKVAAKIESQISAEATEWAEDDTLFQVEINFAPNQSTFSEEQYASDFSKALEIAQTYGGSLIVVEGHSDPLGILRAREKGKTPVEVRQMEQKAKNLSLERSKSVRQAFLSFAAHNKMQVDESQFVSVGLGVVSPKFSPPRTKEEWAANRRVVFRIKQVEAELDEFVPLK
ncbi:ABC transporter substrate-binding protein [Acanthopleuribacter pedis]|uniref:OmpA-like domain-containing protein n=1 Tax=Acanthopleuribacter pedis TaxID=442870 RepID=A0A8J7QHR8_9BACT|nr:ABC transporter substrate-binding protein [Acanthopleuribacter pedis]MBO1317256.1 hypothetical protein [Acanthopleuribacter pedis]MBO1318563.1 hypothetical protein [Acanthopleuribacter pedis]